MRTGIVDIHALSIEWKHGIDVDVFWKMWRANAAAFWGLTVIDSVISVFYILLFFRLFPVALFCTSPTDACSCEGGGFEIYQPFCNVTVTEVVKSNLTSSSSANLTSLATLATLKRSRAQYRSIFEELEAEVATIATSVGAIILIVIVFTSARVYIAYIQAHDAQTIAEMKAARDREENLRLKVSWFKEVGVAGRRRAKGSWQSRSMESCTREKAAAHGGAVCKNNLLSLLSLVTSNLEQDELKSAYLDNGQLAMIKAGASNIEDKVPPYLKLEWKVLKFSKRIGAGSFGDCFMGIKGKQPVAIKRMRVALTDEKGFRAFCKEVVTLSSLDHVNIVKLIGYVLEPCLLIVMEFVSGGMLSDFVEAQDLSTHPPMETLMKILIGSAEGFAYLHARDPMPILHRDIKSENILLTEALEPRIADLGEARTMAKDHAMTLVGLLHTCCVLFCGVDTTLPNVQHQQHLHCLII